MSLIQPGKWLGYLRKNLIRDARNDTSYREWCVNSGEDMNAKYKTRREFIKTCLRFGIGGGLIFAGIALGTRKRTDTNESDLCEITSPCQGCSQYSGCSLPKAQKFKSSAEGGTHGQK